MKQQENHLKIKDSVNKQILKLKNVILPALRSLGIGGLFIFCFLNLISSQLISPLYSKIVNNDKAATISFLQKIKGLPEYQNVLDMNDNVYGQTIEMEIAMSENKKKAMINDLERQLAINPRSRDILYSLYQLNFAEGDKNQASYYLKLAKDIDPAIK